jgi:predicted permease
MIDGLLQDSRYALRTLANSPGFVAVAVFSLALGIGANTAIFSIVNGVLFKPMPVHSPDELVAVYATTPRLNVPSQFSYPDYLDYREQNDVFTDIFAHFGVPLNLADGEKPEMVWGEIVTGNYFTGLGAEPVVGRTLVPEDDTTPGAHPVAVLRHGYWERRFGADPSVVGRTVKLNGREFTLVGVAPKGFTGTKFLGFTPDLWVPLMMHAQVWPGSEGQLDMRGANWLQFRARLKPGVTATQAEAAMNTIAQRLEATYPETNRELQMHVIPGSTKTEPFLEHKGFMPIASAVLMGVVGLVLLVACANLANLLLARAFSRSKEIAVRLAMGASRLRLVRQLLIESLLLSLLGGFVGLLLGIWFLDVMAFQPVLDFPIDYDLSLDGRVLTFSILLALTTGVFFGLTPALHASRPNLIPVLRGDSGSPRPTGRRFSGRNLLVVSQVAVSLVLLIAAGLFLRSFENARALDPGFDTDKFLLLSVNLGLQGYEEAEGRGFYRQAIERLESVPGVRSASLARPLPLDASSSATDVVIDELQRKAGEDEFPVFYTVAGAAYFATMGTKLLQGRGFNEHDTESSPGVVVINETMARRFWPNQNAIGKRFRVWGVEGKHVEVVGVAKDGKYMTLGEDLQPFLFLPLEQNYSSQMTFLVRTEGNPRDMLASVREEIQTLDAELPIFGIKSMDEYMSRHYVGPEAIASLAGVFALVALLLASVGIYGVMSYAVVQRTHEIGIRMALGARQRDVLGMVVRQGLIIVFIGIVIGAAAAMASTRAMTSLLYEVSTSDPGIYLIVCSVLASAALLACLVPARRAARVDPLVALKYE